MDVKNKIAALRALYMSHTEAVQNVVRLHKANSNSGLEEISSLAAYNAHSIEEVGTTDQVSSCFISYHTSWMALIILWL